jgi:hypothetical protein
VEGNTRDEDHYYRQDINQDGDPKYRVECGFGRSMEKPHTYNIFGHL